MVTPTPATELAWAAGFFDGEGCVTHVRSKKGIGYLHLGVSQSGDSTKLHRFCAAVGAGRVYGPYDTTKNRLSKLERFSWHVAGVRAFGVMDMLSPHLTGDKLDKLDRLIFEGIIIDQGTKGDGEETA